MACEPWQKRNTSCSMLPQEHNRPRPLKFVTALAILALSPSRLRNQTVLRKHPKNPPIIPRKSLKGKVIKRHASLLVVVRTSDDSAYSDSKSIGFSIVKARETILI